MKVKFYLDPKPTSSGERAIWCYVREFDKTYTINTGERAHPDQWDKTSHRINTRKEKDKIKKGTLNSINLFLNAFENKIFDVARNIRSKQFNAGFGVIVDELKRQFNKRETNFFNIYDEYLIIKQSEVTKQTLSKLKHVKSILEEFEKYSNDKITFEKITPIFFSKYYSFLINQKDLLNNTANKNIAFVKSFLIWANINAYADNQSYKSFKGKSETNEVIYLTEDELMSLYNLDLKENERLTRVRDLFVFQCFTGVRYSDLKNITREDIAAGSWKIRTQKTRQQIEIPLNSYAISILSRYMDHPEALPVISNQKMNKYLKELCEVGEINSIVKTIKYQGTERIEKVYKKYEIVGTHTARRTFISLSLQKGMKPEVIMAITGHTDYKMMQKYLKIADEHKREEMDKVWGPSLRLVK